MHTCKYSQVASAFGDEVFFAMIPGSSNGGKQGGGYGCWADAEQVANFAQLQQRSVHPGLDELIGGICGKAPETLTTIKGNASRQDDGEVPDLRPLGA